MNHESPASRTPAAEAAKLRQLIMGFRSSQMVYVAAKLGLADRLDDRPQTADALASAVPNLARSIA
jgi:hypothetical protein